MSTYVDATTASKRSLSVYNAAVLIAAGGDRACTLKAGSVMQKASAIACNSIMFAIYNAAVLLAAGGDRACTIMHAVMQKV